MMQAGKTWLESGGIENTLVELTHDGFEFSTYDGMRVLTLSTRDIIEIIKVHSEYLAKLIDTNE